MTQETATVKKHRVTLTEEELAILQSRLERVKISEYDQHTYAILRHLYGRITHILIREEGVSI